MIRNFKNFVVNESEDFKTVFANNSAVKKIDSLCNKYGYKLYSAYNKKLQNGEDFIKINIRPVKDFHSEISFDDGYFFSNTKPHFTIQTTAYGALDLNDYEKFLKGCNDSYNLVKELNKINLSELPIIEN